MAAYSGSSLGFVTINWRTHDRVIGKEMPRCVFILFVKTYSLYTFMQEKDCTMFVENGSKILFSYKSINSFSLSSVACM